MKKPKKPLHLYGIRNAAELLKRSTATIHYWHKVGWLIPYAYLVHQQPLFTLAELKRCDYERRHKQAEKEAKA